MIFCHILFPGIKNEWSITRTILNQSEQQCNIVMTQQKLGEVKVGIELT